MTDINWNIFKAKFNGRESKIFERLAYSLFCFEHDLKVGIFRFKNQVGIETEPIEFAGNRIGFQAKYYETKIADNKNDIIDSIQKAKTKNPDLTKIFIYTNQEVSESSTQKKKKPKYQIEIEKNAKQLQIVIEWRVPSHFELQLSIPENSYLAEYFFFLGKGLVSFLTELHSHSENILFAVQSQINFNNQGIKIDRNNELSEIKVSQSGIIIIGGDGGCGKTAIIKDLFAQNDNPIYVFKAAEFNIANTSALFRQFGDFTLENFNEAHHGENNKTVVIDSAEKIADLENQDAFKEFLSSLIKNKWEVLFTTRLGYLDDLSFQLIEIYRLPFKIIRIANITGDELMKLSTAYSFKLPTDKKLLTLIQNLFYLDEYLTYYQIIKDKTNIAGFRDILWKKKIQNSSFKKDNFHLAREKCFLKLAKVRCENGSFFLSGDECDGRVLSSLETDEIIKYDTQQNGFFITHDIYEEWALDKIIENEYLLFSSYVEFFNKIGSSLPIRRSFRKWLSEKLENGTSDIKSFIENAIADTSINAFWKDEIIISVLLSEYSISFFVLFERLLLDNSKQYLKKIVFLLRIACKEADNTLFDIISKSAPSDIDPTFLFTKPKGKGWETTIQFIYSKVESFQFQDLTFILPLLEEWTNKNKRGSATRFSAMFALHFYRNSQSNTSIHYGEEKVKKLIKILMNGAFEIKDELVVLLNEIIKDDLGQARTSDDLRDIILASGYENTFLIAALPEYVIRIADKNWHQKKTARHPHDYGETGVELHYLIPSQSHLEYFPASAYQTPIYRLLQTSFSKTIEFIIEFNNRAIENYSISGFDDSIREIEVVIDEHTITKQYISPGIWNTFRGTSAPVVPYLLQSIHMALEKMLLESCKNVDKKIIESWLLYLLRTTRSASITGVVTSIVLAFPDEFFEIALILFNNIDFLQHDNWRKLSEHEAKSIYSIGSGLDYRSKIYEDERLATCNERHRGMSLEDLALNYQFFKSENVSDEQVNNRQTAIWRIIDVHNAKLPPNESLTEYDKVLKLLFTKMDRRKMKPTVEQTDDAVLVKFNPDLDPELKEFTENALKDSMEFTKYLALKLWSTNKFDSRKPSGQYPQYENNPELILKETREIVEQLKKGDDLFAMTNDATPAFSAYALVKDFSDRLSSEDLEYCKEIILDYASAPLKENYSYQIADGVEVSINTLPYLYKLFPEEKSIYNVIFLLILFDPFPIGEYKRICDYAVEAINKSLYGISPNDCAIILDGYLVLRDSFYTSFRLAHLSQPGVFGERISRAKLIDQFTLEHEHELEKMVSNELSLEDVKVEQLELETLETAFQLVSVETKDPSLLNFVKRALPRLFTGLFKRDDSSKYGRNQDYKLRRRFLRRYSYFLLKRKITDIEDYLEPLIRRFNVSQEMGDLLQELITVEDSLTTYNTFWFVWEKLYDVIKNAALTNESRHINGIIHNYLLAFPYWNKNAREWASLKEKEKLFFTKASVEMGKHPAVLYSVAKFLNEIGSGFLNEGLIWLSDILSNNRNLYSQQLETNTIYYLEKLARKYFYLNRAKLKTDRLVKNKMLVILNFLIDKGSANGYLLREDIL